jgi:hypothetical protein
MEVVSKQRKKELLEISKGLDKEKAAAEALAEKTKQMLANPDGNYPAMIWCPPTEKRVRRAPVDGNGDRVVAWEAKGKRGRGELQNVALLPPPAMRARSG